MHLDGRRPANAAVQRTGQQAFERRLLIAVADTYYLVLPNAITAAIRYRVIDGLLPLFTPDNAARDTECGTKKSKPCCQFKAMHRSPTSLGQAKDQSHQC